MAWPEVSQLFGYPYRPQFYVTFRGKNPLYGHVGNLDTVILYQQIPNLQIMNIRSSSRIATTTCIISSVEVSLGQPFLSSLWMFSCFSSQNLRTHEHTVHSGITFTPYTFCSHLWINGERFSTVSKRTTTHTSHSPGTQLRGNSMFILQ